MFAKSLLIVTAIVCGVYCESKITVSVSNETQVDLQTYLADLEVAAATAQYSANLNARLVNMLQELLAQKRVNCNCSDNSKPHKEKAFRLPDYRYVGNTSVGFKLYTEPLTWNEARKSCKIEKSALAVPSSYAEIDILKALLIEAKASKTESEEKSWTPAGFLGLHHLYGKDDWLTVSGEPIPHFLHRYNYASVKSGRPIYPKLLRNGNCTGFDLEAELASMDCNTPFAYFCEKRY